MEPSLNTINWKSVISAITSIAWVLFFLSLPVTSFPFFPADVGGRTLVRPLAIYPLAVLLVLITIPRLFNRSLPRTFIPLIVFILIALIGSVFAFTSDLEVFRGVTPLSRLIRNLVALGLGVAFYFTTTLLHESWEDLSRSLRWLYAGLGLAVLWGTVQIPIVLFNFPPYFKVINFFQGLISTRKLFTTRISGLTFEPKWFAEQICFLLLPFLIAAVLTNRSSFKWRWHWRSFTVTIEWFMLAWSAVTLMFTFSRTGIFILVLMTIVGYLLFRYYFHKKPSHAQKPLRRRLLEGGAIFLVLMSTLFAIGTQNAYFSRLWRYWTEAKTRNRTYLQFIAFEQRFVYLETAFRIFGTNPLIGVGMGNYAFYFDEALPNQPYLPQKEIVRQITPAEGRDRLITPKNLFARLIAETGVIGTGAFLIFLFAIVGCALYLWFSPSLEQRYWAVAAFLSLIVFSVIVFSFDSFALPNMWVVFGLITAAAHLPDPDKLLPETQTA
jgi:hypothetical protein